MDWTESDLTPWYPGHIKPVRNGVYQQMSGLANYLDISIGTARDGVNGVKVLSLQRWHWKSLM